MLRRHNVSILVFLVIACLSFQTAFAEVDTPPVPKKLPQQEFVNETNANDEQVRVKDLDIEPINTEKLKNDVVPDTKQEGKKVIGLFLKTMLAVIFCGAIIYVVLYFVRKYYGSAFINTEYNKEMEALDLSTPSTKEDAFKSFFNRTK